MPYSPSVRWGSAVQRAPGGDAGVPASGLCLTVISQGTALDFLRLELSGHPWVAFREWADYPSLERGTDWRLYTYPLVDLLTTWRLIRREHRQLETIAADYDFIFSDGRYGFHSR